MAEGLSALTMLVRRRPFDRTLFDFGALSLCGAAAALVAGALPEAGGWVLLAGAGAGAAYYVANSTLLVGAWGLTERISPVAAWRERAAWAAPHSVGYGVLAGLLLLAHAKAGLTVFAIAGLPFVFLWLGQKQYVDRSRSGVEQLPASQAELEAAKRRPARGEVRGRLVQRGRAHRQGHRRRRARLGHRPRPPGLPPLDDRQDLARDRERHRQPGGHHPEGHGRARHARRRAHRGQGANRPSTDPLDDQYVGFAPDANLIDVKIADDQGRASVADVIDSLQFVVDKRVALNIKVANLSLTSTEAQSYKFDPLAAAVEQAWFVGVTVVAASGNAGPDSVKYAPGNDPYVVSVGGADDRGRKDLGDDVVAAWTSTGKTQDGFSKPEVMAPGAKLFAPLAPGSQYAAEAAAVKPSGQYVRLGGTSLAAGVVSGAAALLTEEHPEWGPNQIERALIRKSRDVLGTGTEVAVDNARRLGRRHRVEPRADPEPLRHPEHGQTRLRPHALRAR